MSDRALSAIPTSVEQKGSPEPPDIKTAFLGGLFLLTLLATPLLFMTKIVSDRIGPLGAFGHLIGE